MEDIFNQTDNKLIKTFGMSSDPDENIIELSGCTGTLLLVQEDYIVVANAGDSPVFMFRDLG